jgi:hypothetical protein
MAESKSPIICVTCKREFHDDLDADNYPRYVAQYSRLPKRDEAFEFASEVQTLCRYIKAISDVMHYGDNKEIEEDTYDTIFELVGELSEEVNNQGSVSTLMRCVRWRNGNCRQKRPPMRERQGCRHGHARH